jgi:hypothetical protein
MSEDGKSSPSDPAGSPEEETPQQDSPEPESDTTLSGVGSPAGAQEAGDETAPNGNDAEADEQPRKVKVESFPHLEVYELTKRKDPAQKKEEKKGAWPNITFPEEEPEPPTPEAAEVEKSDAERAADSIRPSWETEAVDGESVPGYGEAATLEDSEFVSRTIASKSMARSNTVRWGAAAAILLVVLIGWSLSSGEKEPEPLWDTSDKSEEGQPAAAPAPEETPAAGETEPARAPEPPEGPEGPVETAEPAPAAEGESEAAPAEPVVAEAPETDEAQPEPTEEAVAAAPAEPVAAARPKRRVRARTGGAARPARRETPTSKKLVHIRVSTTPPSAQLKLDGMAVPNPFDAHVYPGGSRRFEASAPGMKPQSRAVPFDRDRTVNINLTGGAAPPPAPQPEKSAAPEPVAPAAPGPKSDGVREREIAPGFRPRLD